MAAGASGATARVAGGGRVRNEQSVVKILLIVAACMVGSMIVIGFASVLLMPALTLAQQKQHLRGCSDNLRRIGVALSQYHDKHGSYPPAFVADETGKPKHSWRVLILPFLGEQDLFNKYDFSEPWDSPVNAKVAEQMPDVFACPSDEGVKVVDETSYMVVTGSKTVFPKSSSTRKADIGDDLSLTIMLVEVHDSGVSWLEPKDIEAAQLRINSDDLGGVGGNHEDGTENGLNVLMADGNPMFLSDTLSDEYLQAMSTINGQEMIPWEVLEK